MFNLKSTTLTIATFAALSFASTASANTPTSVANGLGTQPNIQTYNYTPGHVGDTYFGSSETATFFYKKGVSKLEDGKLQKAEAAFKASLRADGSSKMDKYTLHYLAYISQQQGNETQAKTYAEAYMDLAAYKTVAKK